MTFRQKFDLLINIVEENITSDNDAIEAALAQKFGENIRLLADAFRFISGRTLSRYIRERKLVNVIAYKKHLGISYDEAAVQYGFADAASFSKSAKTCFGKAPTQMTEKDLEQFSPLTLDQLLDAKRSIEDDNSDGMITSFGVSEAQFSEISKTLSIASVYGLSDEDAEFAYSLSKSAGIPIDKACDFVGDFLLQIENGTLIPGYSKTEMAQICCRYNQSCSEAQHIMYELEVAGFSGIEQLPNYYFDIYFSDENSRLGLDVHTIFDMAEAMEAHSLDITDLFDIFDRGQWKYDGDFLEAIENFDEDEEEYDRLMQEATTVTIEEMRRQDSFLDEPEHY